MKNSQSFNHFQNWTEGCNFLASKTHAIFFGIFLVDCRLSIFKIHWPRRGKVKMSVVVCAGDGQIEKGNVVGYRHEQKKICRVVTRLSLFPA